MNKIIDNGINVLSLFDGISCGQIALQRAGIKVNKYFASEIDKHAIKVTQHNWPETIQLGSVADIKASDLPKIDLIIGGSPCQSFSFCGKKSGMSTIDKQDILTLEHYLQLKLKNYKFNGQSYLFWEYARLVKEIAPKYFLLENVRMVKKWQDVITGVLDVEPILINSSKLSAQNRVRLYWTNIPNVFLPEDKKIMLKDIVDKNDTSHNIFIYNGAAQRTRYKDDGGSKQVIEIRKDGKANALLTGTAKSLLAVGNTSDIRKFTPEESERLQTVPVGYTSCISNYQRYRCLGNGWTADVIAHILSFLPNELK